VTAALVALVAARVGPRGNRRVCVLVLLWTGPCSPAAAAARMCGAGMGRSPPTVQASSPVMRTQFCRFVSAVSLLVFGLLSSHSQDTNLLVRYARHPLESDCWKFEIHGGGELTCLRDSRCALQLSAPFALTGPPSCLARFEWKGAWSDSDTRRWTDAMVRELKPTFSSDDGRFWIVRSLCFGACFWLYLLLTVVLGLTELRRLSTVFYRRERVSPVRSDDTSSVARAATQGIVRLARSRRGAAVHNAVAVPTSQTRVMCSCVLASDRVDDVPNASKGRRRRLDFGRHFCCRSDCSCGFHVMSHFAVVVVYVSRSTNRTKGPTPA
jgi:hypothetical protein